VPLDLRTFLGEPPAAWRIVAERKIQEWIESGGPDRLTNKGQPLDLTENPFTPVDLRMAFKVLKNADVAPDWIEIAKEIEAELSRVREDGRRFHDGQRRDRILMRSAPDAQLDDIRTRMRDRAAAFDANQRARYRHVNGLIDRFNVACPVAHLHRAKLDADREIAQALRAPPGVVA
jgi:hypothetical protein